MSDLLADERAHWRLEDAHPHAGPTVKLASAERRESASNRSLEAERLAAIGAMRAPMDEHGRLAIMAKTGLEPERPVGLALVENANPGSFAGSLSADLSRIDGSRRHNHH